MRPCSITRSATDEVHHRQGNIPIHAGILLAVRIQRRLRSRSVGGDPLSALTDPKLNDPDTGSPDDHSHYASKKALDDAVVNGGWIIALCGVRFQPVRDPERFPICERCKFLLGQLPDTPGAPSSN